MRTLAQVRHLKEQGKDIVLTGSITLAHAVIEAGLVRRRGGAAALRGMSPERP